MKRSLRLLCAGYDYLERTTEWSMGPAHGRWSWFQVTWAGLHAAALMMHGLSVVYHVRRAKQAAVADEVGPDVGWPSSVPVLISTARRSDGSVQPAGGVLRRPA
jgi:hypothetical protein